MPFISSKVKKSIKSPSCYNYCKNNKNVSLSLISIYTKYKTQSFQRKGKNNAKPRGSLLSQLVRIKFHWSWCNCCMTQWEKLILISGCFDNTARINSVILVGRPCKPLQLEIILHHNHYSQIRSCKYLYNLLTFVKSTANFFLYSLSISSVLIKSWCHCILAAKSKNKYKC